MLLLALALSPLRPAAGRIIGPPSSLEEPANDTVTVYFPFIPAEQDNAVELQYGIVFISSAEGLADEQQYQNALSLDPAWNRWPLYWFYVETSPGVFNWTTQDAAIQGDIAHNLRTNAILLGTPAFYATEAPEVDLDDPLPRSPISLPTPQTATPVGLYDPIFDDGTDVPGLGKGINSNNVWARFVFTAVNRYKPGGVLAQANGWPAGQGITHWEMWNEPDLSWFWDGTLADYARLLKVGYLAARQADPNAQVLFGGLANNFNYLNYYADVLAVYSSDPIAVPYNYFHDILATHNYLYAWRSWFHIDRVRSAQQALGLAKPIWLNETGVPAWDDYPGPVWEPTSPLRASMSEQANFLVQSTFYATYAGAEAIFYFQLYDGCGNQPVGTDFPPHNGELCDENGRLIYDPQYPCAGDAYGLFRNPSDAVCFSQHPQPETPRPVATTYQFLATTFNGVEPYWWLRTGGSDPNNGTQEWIAFYRPATRQRIVGLWARHGNDETAVLPATAGSALLLHPDGTGQTIVPSDGHYTLLLPGATNQNAPWDPTLFPIGGSPLILVEYDYNHIGPPPQASAED